MILLLQSNNFLLKNPFRTRAVKITAHTHSNFDSCTPTGTIVILKRHHAAKQAKMLSKNCLHFLKI